MAKVRRISDILDGPIQNLPGFDREKMLISRRVQKVQTMWSEVVDPFFLPHTNAVYILKKDGYEEMHVYVDESIYAAELNARRELIMIKLKDRYGEDIEKLDIHISRGKRKQIHPFVINHSTEIDKNPAIPLDEEEIEKVEQTCSTIEDTTLKERFKKAMIADLEWKKGNR